MTAETTTPQDTLAAAEVAVAAVEQEKLAEAEAPVVAADNSKPPKTVEKSSSYREESNFPSDLKDSERKSLNELKTKLEEAIAGNTLFQKTEQPKTEQSETEKDDDSSSSSSSDDVSLWGVSLLPSKSDEGIDVILLKFLRAREFKVTEAFEMLKKTLQWRKETKMDSILDEENLGSSELSSAAFMDGVDREGHPVCYNVFGVFDSEEVYEKTLGTEEKRKEFLRWRCQVMEKGIRKLNMKPGGVSSLLQVNDLKNSPGPAKKELRLATKQALAILQDNYPEMVAKNIFINVPFWYYAVNALLSPFLTQRTKSKFVVARPAKVTETLLKYISIEEIPVHYGGFKRENDFEFSSQDDAVSEITLKPGSTASIEIPAPEGGKSLVWDLTVLGWEVNYKEEFVPSDEGSYTVIVQKGKKMSSQEGPIRNSFRNNEAGKMVLTVENSSNKKKRVMYRYKISKN